MRHEVCVVGAGGAGLAAAHALRERGIPFRVLEARDGIGGMWRHGQTFAYASLTSNTSRYRTSFRAHRMRRRGPPYVHHTEFLAYLEAFADRFGLREAIELGARVVAAGPDGDAWSVTAEGRDPEPFRAVVVATGVLGRPRRRAIPGDFAGRRLHSADYDRPGEFAGQDVVVTGMGASGLEVAGDVAGHARSVTIAVRRGTFIAPRFLLPRVPLDLVDSRLASRLLSFDARRRALALMVARTTRLARRHGMPAPDHRLMEEPVALSDTFVRALRRGQVTLRPGIERFEGERVVFADGTAQRADAVIEACGFDPDLRFLPEHLVAGFGEYHMPLLRGVAHPEQDGLFFVGFTAGQGALLPMMEAQARWAAAVLAGELPWPPPEERRRCSRRRPGGPSASSGGRSPSGATASATSWSSSARSTGPEGRPGVRVP
ncbi:MAG TPA: NAD(P)-binding domain-containing protein [Solirubrobacteraceae bacterium]|nr:NAD(P)-binding domain-containing protein [Solirubrobacteraceae bacterium]